MPDSSVPDPQVDAFIMSCIDSVPHLEALLLFWNSRPKAWCAEEMAKSLFVEVRSAKIILQDLTRYGLIDQDPNAKINFVYDSSPDKDRIIGLLDQQYRRDLIRISTMIHAKPSASIREFARAFRFKKERE